MRPVRAGMVRYQDIHAPGLDLADFALMNDFLAVEADNAALAQQRD